MKKGFAWSLACCLLLSCADYTPKPKGYPRIEPAAPRYAPLQEAGLPYAFEVSRLATVELPPAGEPAAWINIAYPELRATVYCSYLPVTPHTFPQADRESRALLFRQARQADVSGHTYAHPASRVYAILFEVAGEAASPLQFVITDSVSHFFRGALYYDSPGNADSVAPATAYLRTDIMEMIRTFYWKD